jgi:hypothetical protein
MWSLTSKGQFDLRSLQHVLKPIYLICNVFKVQSFSFKMLTLMTKLLMRYEGKFALIIHPCNWFHRKALANGLEWPCPCDYTNLFWMEGNSSIKADHLVSFWVGFEKKNSFCFNLIKHVLQTYQPHFRAYSLSSSSLSHIVGGPNIPTSSVSKSNIHSFVSSTIVHFSVRSIMPLPMFLGSSPSKLCTLPHFLILIF